MRQQMNARINETLPTKKTIIVFSSVKDALLSAPFPFYFCPLFRRFSLASNPKLADSQGAQEMRSQKMGLH
jgi:hypothetical protein